MTGDFAATRIRGQGAGPAPPAIRGWLLDEWSLRTWRVAGATLLTLTGLAIYLAAIPSSTDGDFRCSRRSCWRSPAC